MTGAQDDGEDLEDKDLLHPQEIDAHWLQRRIAESYREAGSPIDPGQSQNLANDFFDILQASTLPISLSKVCVQI